MASRWRDAVLVFTSFAVIGSGFFCLYADSVLLARIDKVAGGHVPCGADRSNDAARFTYYKILILEPSIDHGLAYGIATSVVKHAEAFGHDPNFVLAMIKVESRHFDPKSESTAGAIGLMQVLPQWLKNQGMQDADLTDIDVNIELGLRVFGFYMEMYNDLEKALTAYNRGPGPVDWADRFGRDPRNGYAASILEVFEELKKIDGVVE